VRRSRRRFHATAGPSIERRRSTVARPRIAARVDQGCGNARAIPAFRRVHVAAILVNLAQLALIVGTLIAVSISLR
jgi:hypothetical protein